MVLLLFVVSVWLNNTLSFAIAYWDFVRFMIKSS